MEDSVYTGREIAIFADAHSLYEPTKAALEDIASRGITEIYSLGDNVGVGPNPSEVMDLLEEYGVQSVAGNSEDYINLGLEPFTYFHELKKQTFLWTLSKLNERQKGLIKLFPHSIELIVGGKKLALVHFASDVRFDFQFKNNTEKYQQNMKENNKAYEQFLFTNSPEQIAKMDEMIKKYGEDSPIVKGFLSAKDDPLFSGHRVDMFDAIIQGHVHFKLYEQSPSTEYYSIRAVGMAFEPDQIDKASYVILRERKDEKGFDLEEVLVKFDREKMESAILNCDIPGREKLEKFTSMKR